MLLLVSYTLSPAERVSDISFQSAVENLAHSRRLTHSGGIEHTMKDSSRRRRDTKGSPCYLLPCSELETEQPVWGYGSGFFPLNGGRKPAYAEPSPCACLCDRQPTAPLHQSSQNPLQLELLPHFTDGETEALENKRSWVVFIWKVSKIPFDPSTSLKKPSSLRYCIVIQGHCMQESFGFYQTD